MQNNVFYLILPIKLVDFVCDKGIVKLLSRLLPYCLTLI